MTRRGRRAETRTWGVVRAWGAHPAGTRALALAFRSMAFRAGGSALLAGRRGDRWGPVVLGVVFLGAGVLAGTYAAGFASTSGVAAALLVFVVYFTLVAFLEHSAVLSAPDDYRTIGHLPVGSRTYYTGRLAGSAMVLAPFVGVFALPAVAGAARKDLAGALALAVGGAALSLAVLCGANALQRLLVRRASPRQARRRLTLAQTGAMLLYFNGFWVLAEVLGPAAGAGPSWLSASWQPTAWFAELGRLLAGSGGDPGMSLAAVSVTVLAALGATRPLRPGFGEAALEELGVWEIQGTKDRGGEGREPEGEAPGAPAGAGIALPGRPLLERLLHRRGRGGALFTLAWSHVRGDVRILAQLASVLPATLVVVLLSLRDGRLADPFLSSSELGTWTFLYIYVVLIYFLVNEALTRSSFHKAAWLFHSAAADPVWVHRRLRRSTRILVLWPYLLVLALFLYLHHGHPGHALLHALLLGVGAEAALPLLVATAPRFPFSESVQRSGARGRMVAGTLLLSACVGPVFTLVHHLCLRDPGRFAATLALLVLAGIGTNMAAARRMRRVLAEAEFAG